MNYLTYRINDDKQKQIESLVKCLSLDNDLTYVKHKLYYVNLILIFLFI